MALRVRAVRPIVSMKVLWKEISAETRGTVVEYLTFLRSVSKELENRNGGHTQHLPEG